MMDVLEKFISDETRAVVEREGTLKRDAGDSETRRRLRQKMNIGAARIVSATETKPVVTPGFMTYYAQRLQGKYWIGVAQHQKTTHSQKAKSELVERNLTPGEKVEVQKAKLEEFTKLKAVKKALRLPSPAESEVIRRTKSDRIVSSRHVLIVKDGENPNDAKACKARLTANGYLDPDLMDLAKKQPLLSPTAASMSKWLVLQLIASQRWQLQIGDVQGAFLEADPLDREAGAIFISQPPGGLPGLERGQICESVTPLYGFNDAPARWFRKWSCTAKDCGWTQSTFDPCVWYVVGPSGSVMAVICLHVDDAITGGADVHYHTALAKMKERFPFRKWAVGEGSFVESYLKQHEDGMIEVSQEKFANDLKEIKVRRGDPESPGTEEEQTQAKGVLGAVGWLANQTRPDLSVLVAMGQQRLGNKLKLKHLRGLNQMVRRAKMFASTTLKFWPTDFQKVRALRHTDASYDNTGDGHSQGGAMVVLVSDNMMVGETAKWSPLHWRSFKLRRAVNSTLAAETQALSDRLGALEWVQRFLLEMQTGHVDLGQTQNELAKTGAGAVVDCKSVWDHVTSAGTAGAVKDKRTAIEFLAVRQSLMRCGVDLRWSPTKLMLADSLTKDQGEPADLLRAVMKSGEYQLSAESTPLNRLAEEKERRKAVVEANKAKQASEGKKRTKKKVEPVAPLPAKTSDLPEPEGEPVPPNSKGSPWSGTQVGEWNVLLADAKIAETERTDRFLDWEWTVRATEMTKSKSQKP